jgi:hypothetical protein
LLVAFTLLGGWLRFSAINFGLPDQFRPDEEKIVPRALDFEEIGIRIWRFIRPRRRISRMQSSAAMHHSPAPVAIFMSHTTPVNRRKPI